MFLGNCLISWHFKKQATVSRSSTEAKYHALASTGSELTWIIQLLLDFQISISLPTLLFCDNQIDVHIVTNPIFHKRTKHIEFDCHFVRDKVLIGQVKLLPIQSHHQLTDIFTKTLPCSRLFPLLSKKAILNAHSPS